MYPHLIVWRAIQQTKVNWVIKTFILADLIILSASQLFGPIFAIFIENKINGDVLEIVGVAAAIYLFSRSIVEIPVGIFVDRTSSEKDDLITTIVGIIVMACVYFLYTLIDSVWQLYALQALLGISTALAWPGWYSIFTRHIDKTKEAFEWSLYDVVVGIGMATTAVVGSMIVKSFGFDWVFYLASIFTLLGALALLTLKAKLFSQHRHSNLL
ncbi:MFS transporter [Candidatus Uhrbacteria bacterium]|nr:MFS transporter [Candidatus Uhrbacteria bacterium]